MCLNKISLVFLILSGLLVCVRAGLTAKITSRQPSNLHVFERDLIRLKCEANQNDVDIFWRYDKPDDAKPSITNSSNTNIVTWNAGNTTISILDVKVIQRNRGLFRIYCVAKDKVNNNKNDNEPFEFVPDSSIPKLSVAVPQTQTVENGTRRHNLQCDISSTVRLDKFSISWLFNKQIIAEKSFTKADKGSHNFLLQCLTEKDLGNYTCLVNTTMYKRTWQQSGVLLLTGKFPNVPTTYVADNLGMKNGPWLSLYWIIFFLMIGKIV